ncbi:peroxidase [Acinetobacter sp. NCu2D-2]|uniref:alpha/beta fold hydrolase n=1 Tax=Acinetobacter sp. NCu2D-2 TaxID=1608473 RepID=UPI0007CDE451|nr:alpha/beta hydrolase [Acinetobacter sp. NCu2D-2]ANF81881.1 peroxidase [Acinetobacter sp. NCu2D-2]
MPFYQMPDGEQLFVREYGQGQPVLVLSGLGMLSWQWSAFLYLHRKQFRFIIPEWRGFGASSQCKIPQQDAISSHWQDVQALIQQLDLKDVIVIAYSMGATTTMHGLKYGEFAHHIAAYLHIDQTPKISIDDDWPYGLFGEKHTRFKTILKKLSNLLEQNQDKALIQDLAAEDRKRIANLWLDFIALQNNNKYALKAFEWALQQSRLQTYLLPSSRVDYMAWYINNYLHHSEDYREAIRQLNCPVTFFTGMQSQLYPAIGQTQIAQSLSNAQQVCFEKSGHTPLITEPLKFAKEIARFLKENKQSDKIAA